MIFIQDKSKIERFQSILDSLSVYFQLTDESEINYTIETGKSDGLLYCRIIQYTTFRKKMEYYIEYRIDQDVIVLEINFPVHIHKTIYKMIKSNLKYKNSSIEKLKNTITCKFFYNYEDIGMLLSVGFLMIEIFRLKNL